MPRPGKKMKKNFTSLEEAEHHKSMQWINELNSNFIDEDLKY